MFVLLLRLITESYFRDVSSTLINGKGRYPGGPTDVDLAVVNVVKGRRSAAFTL